jgi:cytochrome c biogenesis protein CcdA
MGDSSNPQQGAQESGTRWRVFPAALFAVAGGLLSLVCVGSLVLLLLGISRPPSTVSTLRHAAGLVLMSAVGVVCLFTSRCWWRQQWIAGLVGTVTCYALGVFAASLAWPEMGR